jgi:hypothetical protein
VLFAIVVVAALLVGTLASTLLKAGAPQPGRMVGTSRAPSPTRSTVSRSRHQIREPPHTPTRRDRRLRTPRRLVGRRRALASATAGRSTFTAGRSDITARAVAGGAESVDPIVAPLAPPRLVIPSTIERIPSPAVASGRTASLCGCAIEEFGFER